MLKHRKFLFVIIAGLALCKYAHADWNVTKEPERRSMPCSHQGNNCTDANLTEAEKWSGHFSKCPKEYTHYCINGMCRYVKEEQQPACICEHGYTGSRCEMRVFFYIGERKQIIIICVITALVFVLLLIIFICICVHRRKLCHKRRKRKEDKSGEIEKLNTIPTEEKDSLAVNVESSETNSV
ncbi:probetacellulin [Amia ocellicauda]|uniref:probetacellulin n=1 Tax=Amia ocellicauda TaxID=2972642 RepID=UPI003463BAA6